MICLTGIAASQGIAIGSAFVYRPEPLTIERRLTQTPVAEVERLLQAIEAVQAVLVALQEHTQETIGHEEAQIFEAHRMFLTDPVFADEIKQIIHEEHINAEAAVERVSNALIAEFEALDDDYFRQRKGDIKDVAQRLLRQLLGLEETTLSALTQPAIIIAHDLTPSDTASLNRKMALGLCTEIGSGTSHTAILSRSLDIPAVVGVGQIEISSGVKVIIDGSTGQLIIDPDEATLATYEAQQKAQAQAR
jgi:phosphotransferase system enzyme I (PtsI)